MDNHATCPMCHCRWGDCPFEPGECAYIKTRDTDDTQGNWLTRMIAMFRFLFALIVLSLSGDRRGSKPDPMEH